MNRAATSWKVAAYDRLYSYTPASRTKMNEETSMKPKTKMAPDLQGSSMSKLGTALLAVAVATAFATGVAAQTVTPRDAIRPPAELVTTPPASPRDGQDRKDIEKDRSDADLAIERDKCGDLADDAKDRCIRAARAQRDLGVPRRGTAATPVAPSSSTNPSPQSPSSVSPAGGGTSGSAAPAAGGTRR
jgi:hypothetical protein